MSAIADVVIVIEPGNHEFPVQPMVANYINQNQRELAKLKQERDEARAYAEGLKAALQRLLAAYEDTDGIPTPLLDIAHEALEPAAVARERVGE